MPNLATWWHGVSGIEAAGAAPTRLTEFGDLLGVWWRADFSRIDLHRFDGTSWILLEDFQIPAAFTDAPGGVAIDPSTGDMLLGFRGVYRYVLATGTYAPLLAVPVQVRSFVLGVAVTATGDIYVAGGQSIRGVVSYRTYRYRNGSWTNLGNPGGIRVRVDDLSRNPLTDEIHALVDLGSGRESEYRFTNNSWTVTTAININSRFTQPTVVQGLAIDGAGNRYLAAGTSRINPRRALIYRAEAATPGAYDTSVVAPSNVQFNISHVAYDGYRGS